jgi:hypothetical protein
MNAPKFTEIDIAFGRFPDLERIFGIKRGTAYALINEGKIRSRIVRRKGCAYGMRLIDFDSVREFLANAPDEPSKTVSREMSRRGLASGKKRAQRAAANTGKNGAVMSE